MNILKFLNGFNTTSTYLVISLVVLIFLVAYFYFINPV
nr:hypothetical protein [Acinetobacter sp. NCu2D-2]